MASLKEVGKVIAKLHKTYGSIKPLGINCYYCDCHHVTKTVDIDAGVSPFMLKCEKCQAFARSSFYKDIAPGADPTIEFYRPGEKELLRLSKKDKQLYDHVCAGGLLYRKINQNGNIQNGGESVQDTTSATENG